MRKIRSAVLTITFSPDPVDYAIVTAFSIPEKKAYQASVTIPEHLRALQTSFDEVRKAWREHILDNIKTLKRSANSDFDDDPIAPVQQMFSKGFYETDWNSDYYAGMGHFGHFLGMVECRYEGDEFTIIRGVEDPAEVPMTKCPYRPNLEGGNA